MSTPRHLWSGDWQEESDAVAERLARGRRPAEDQPGPPPEPAPVRRPPRQRPAPVRAARGRHYRATVLVLLATLLSAGVAYAVVSSLVGSGGAVASGAPPWLGIDTTSAPLGPGALIADVASRGPAQAAGLMPGDVITQIGSRPVATPADVESALAGMHAGERVEIQYERGPVPFATLVTLAARPPNP